MKIYMYNNFVLTVSMATVVRSVIKIYMYASILISYQMDNKKLKFIFLSFP